MRTFTALAAAALLLGGVGALVTLRAQQDQPVFALGPAEVVGSVSITNEPTVHARQVGMWRVSLANLPTMRTLTPEFLQVGTTYAVRWPGAERVDSYRIVGLGSDGWARGELLEGGAARWVNTSLAMTIEEVPPR